MMFAIMFPTYLVVSRQRSTAPKCCSGSETERRCVCDIEANAKSVQSTLLRPPRGLMRCRMYIRGDMVHCPQIDNIALDESVAWPNASL